MLPRVSRQHLGPQLQAVERLQGGLRELLTGLVAVFVTVLVTGSVMGWRRGASGKCKCERRGAGELGVGRAIFTTAKHS